MNQNPFTITFGVEPINYIERLEYKNFIIDDFESSRATNYIYLITGTRGSGKTVFMSSIANYFTKKDDWIVIDASVKENMLENIASEIYESAISKIHFLKGEFSFSFSGITFSLKGETPVTTTISLIKKMLDIIIKKDKKVLITIDEIDNSKEMKLFVEEYQSLLRQNYPIRLLMAGLYENISKLQDNKSITFFYRAPKLEIKNLSIAAISYQYQKFLDCNKETSIRLAKLTKGYAYAYQVLGYLLFKQHKKDVDDDVLSLFDEYLREYVYDKVYDELSLVERKIIKGFDTNEEMSVKDLTKNVNINEKTMSVYRARLIKKGIINSLGYGKIEFALPRFKEFLEYK